MALTNAEKQARWRKRNIVTLTEFAEPKKLRGAVARFGRHPRD
jgi:hypothetical protein